MPWHWYLALKQLFPTGRGCSFFSLTSIIGVMLGVMVLIIVQSVMNGFSHEIESKIIDTNGDIRIESNQIIYDYDELLKELERNEKIDTAAPYAQGIVMLQHYGRPAFPFIRGIPIEKDRQVIPIDDYIQQGELYDLDDETILVSSQLAMNLGIDLGNTIEVYTPLMLERLKQDEILLPRELIVAGIFETGWSQIDGNTLICTLPLMQELYGLEDGIHGIALRLNNPSTTSAMANWLNTHLLDLPYRALTWMDTDQDLLFILRLEKTTMFFIILFIIIVASFSIASSLMTTVVRKTKEIGLLAAMGARRKHIALVFCIQGLIIGTVGTALGVLCAMTALHYRNTIIHALAKVTQSEAALLRYYQFADIPVQYQSGDFIVIITFSILIATLAGLLPALRASKLKPAEALRSE